MTTMRDHCDVQRNFEIYTVRFGGICEGGEGEMKRRGSHNRQEAPISGAGRIPRVPRGGSLRHRVPRGRFTQSQSSFATVYRGAGSPSLSPWSLPCTEGQAHPVSIPGGHLVLTGQVRSDRGDRFTQSQSLAGPCSKGWVNSLSLIKVSLAETHFPIH